MKVDEVRRNGSASILNQQLEGHLERLASVLEPYVGRIDKQYIRRLRALGYPKRQIEGLALITSGAAARKFQAGEKGLQFFESVSSAGKLLAKLNLPPSEVMRALQEYDHLLEPHLKSLPDDELAGFRWVREQLQFCVILALNEAYYYVREAETHALHQIFRIELEAHNIDLLFRRFLEAVTGVCKADAGHLYLLSKDSSVWQLCASTPTGVSAETLQTVPNTAPLTRHLSEALTISQSQRTKVLLDPGWRIHFPNCWSFPLMEKGKLAGVMQFGFRQPREWLPRDRDLLAAAAERCLMAAQKMRLVEDLAFREQQIRNLAEHMLQVEEMERRRISRELHDEAGQSLVCIRLMIEMIEMSLPPSADEWREKLAEARDLTEKTILEMRRLIADLSPVILEQFGLESALRQLLKRFEASFRCDAHLNVDKVTGLPPKMEMVVYRIIQECCNNISKHSHATNVNISVTSADEVLSLQVSDDGIGFEVEAALAKKDSFGLAGIRERVALLGGKFHVRSGYLTGKKKFGSGARGTEVNVELPIRIDQNW
ncbi:MAG: GAF domain-containing sensor histidine kinase [Bryobacteraceae bacterium]